jgi:hypothetical protein
MESNLLWPYLPDDITISITFHLDAKSLFSMTKVCKQWQRNLWRYITRFELTGQNDDNEPYRGDSFRNFIGNSLSRLEHSKIQDVVLPGSFYDDAYESINVVDDNLDTLAKMTNLHSFSIPTDPYIIPVDLMSVLTKFTQLTSLRISFDLEEEDASQLTRLSKLKVLHFHHPHLDEMHWVNKLPQLGTLHLETLPSYSYSLADCSQLTSLTLRAVEDKYMEALLQLTQLKELYLGNVYDPCLAQLTNLTKLGIGRFPSWDSNDDLPPHIKSLSVDEINKDDLQSFTCLSELYTPDFLLDMVSVSTLTQLHTLVLRADPSITLSQLTNLTRLGFKEWDGELSPSSFSVFSSLSNLRVWEYSSSSSEITPSQIAAVFPLGHVSIGRRKFASLRWE